MIWLWIILAFVWGICSGGILIALIQDDWFEDRAGSIFGVLMTLGGIGTVIVGLSALYINEKIESKEGKVYQCLLKCKGTTMWIWNKTIGKLWDLTIMGIIKRKDHKEMDEKEDEWKIERLGIKSK